MRHACSFKALGLKANILAYTMLEHPFKQPDHGRPAETPSVYQLEEEDRAMAAYGGDVHLGRGAAVGDGAVGV